MLTLLRGRDRDALVDALDGRSPAAGPVTDLPVPAVEAHATGAPPLPALPVRCHLAAAPLVPAPPGLADDVLPGAVARAAARARALLEP